MTATLDFGMLSKRFAHFGRVQDGNPILQYIWTYVCEELVDLEEVKWKGMLNMAWWEQGATAEQETEDARLVRQNISSFVSKISLISPSRELFGADFESDMYRRLIA